MEAKTFLYLGIALGFIAGVILTVVIMRIRSLFVSSEVRRLRQEKKVLEKRLQEKNRHIDEMMGHAEKLAQDFERRRLEKGDH